MSDEPRSCVICRAPVPASIPGRKPRGETCGSARCRQAKSRRDAAEFAAYQASPEGQAAQAAERAAQAEREDRAREYWAQVRAGREASEEAKRIEAETSIWRYGRGAGHEDHYGEDGCARAWSPDVRASLVGDVYELLGSESSDGVLPTVTVLSENLQYLARSDVRTLLEISEDGEALITAMQAIVQASRAEARRRPKEERDAANRERREARAMARAC